MGSSCPPAQNPSILHLLVSGLLTHHLLEAFLGSPVLHHAGLASFTHQPCQAFFPSQELIFFRVCLSLWVSHAQDRVQRSPKKGTT